MGIIWRLQVPFFCKKKNILCFSTHGYGKKILHTQNSNQLKKNIKKKLKLQNFKVKKPKSLFFSFEGSEPSNFKISFHLLC